MEVAYPQLPNILQKALNVEHHIGEGSLSMLVFDFIFNIFCHSQFSSLCLKPIKKHRAANRKQFIICRRVFAIGRSIDQSIDRSIDRFIDRLIARSIDRLIDQLID
jgi:hypothetical protein